MAKGEHMTISELKSVLRTLNNVVIKAFKNKACIKISHHRDTDFKHDLNENIIDMKYCKNETITIEIEHRETK